MAEQEKKVILTVDTGESQRTVKSLKQEISDLKDAILNLEKGSDAYNDAVEQLTASQRELNEVQALTKKTATALDGSYDALVHRMSLLKKEWRATADEARRAELGQEIAQINQELKDLDAELGNYQRNVGNYVSHWEGMPDVVEEVSQSTMTFQQRMSEMNQSIEPTKQSFEAVSQLASGLAGGFAAVQGAMALLGKENENLEQTFIKLQAAMALAQGIGGMKGLVEGAGKAKVALAELSAKATAAGGGIKGLMKVMGKSGWITIILAVVSALTLLFKNLPMVKKQEAAWEAQIRSTVEAQERLHNSIEKSNEKLSDRIELLKAQGVEERKLLELQIEQAKANKDTAWRDLMKAQNKYIDVKSDAQGVMEMTNGAFKQKYGMNKEDALEHYKGLMDSATEFYHSQEQLYNDYLHQMEVLDAQDRTSFERRLKAYADSLKAKEELLREQYETDLALAEKYGLDKTVIEEKYQKDLAELRAKANTTPDTIEVPEVKEDVNATLRKTIQDRIKLEEGASKRKLELLEVERQKEVANAYATITDKTKLQEELERIEREYAGKEYDIEQELLQEKLNILNEWKNANTDAQVERLEIAEEIADTEVEIEKHKQDRLTEIARQGNEDRQQQQTSGTTSTTAQEGLGMIDDFKQQVKTFNEDWKSMNFTQKAAEIGNVVNQSLAGASQIFNQLADMYSDEEELSKEEQKKVKNLRIAGATMDMLSGIVGAISSTAGMGPVGWALGAIQAGIITTTGIMNIQKIKNTDVTGGSTSSLGGGASVTPNIGSYSSELPVNYTRNITTSSEMDELNKEQKVYILESDIQESNKKVSIRESESSF